MDASLDGLLTGLTLIVAIGAQNAYVLRQGLRRAYVAPVTVVCAVSDFVLILAGVRFSCWSGLMSAGGPRRPPPPPSAAQDDRSARPAVIRRAVALTWLNP